MYPTFDSFNMNNQSQHSGQSWQQRYTPNHGNANQQPYPPNNVLRPQQRQAQPQQQWQYGHQQPVRAAKDGQQQTSTTTHVTTKVKTFYSGGQRQAYPPAATPIPQPQLPTPAPARPTIDYESLKVAAPPTPAPLPAPPAQPQQTQRNTQHTTTTTTRVERYEGEQAGGKTRRQAEAQGEAQLRRYERQVRVILDETTCRAGYPWFNMKGGYLCGGGHHWLSHHELDLCFSGRKRSPQNELVHAVTRLGGEGRVVHPPEAAGRDMPMHTFHRDAMTMAASMGHVVWAGEGSQPCECVGILGIPVVKGGNGQRKEVVRNPEYVKQGYCILLERSWLRDDSRAPKVFSRN